MVKLDQFTPRTTFWATKENPETTGVILTNLSLAAPQHSRDRINKYLLVVVESIMLSTTNVLFLLHPPLTAL